MDYIDPKTIRQSYIKTLLEEKHILLAELLMKKDDNEPILHPRYIQEESEPNFDSVNKNIAETTLDIASLDNGLIAAAIRLNDIYDTAVARLSSVQKMLDDERERLMDTNMICKNVTEFTAVKPLNSNAFSGKFYASPDGKNISCYQLDNVEETYSIIDVTGNGMRGNMYVKQRVGANETETDTSDVSAINDGDMFSLFEYSRIETTNTDEALSGVIYYDDQPVRCTITLYSEKQTTMADIRSEDPYLIVEDVQTSVDGIYYSSALTNELMLNNKEFSYNDYQYIYGSGIIAYAPSNYVRITFRSDRKTDDTIVVKETELAQAKRKTIAINGISLYDLSYEQSEFTSEEMIKSGHIDSVALFSNVYIPNNFRAGTNYIRMDMIVNGISYPIVPVNGNDDGYKVIRYDPNKKSAGYVKYITDPISSVKIHVILTPYNEIQTPYIGNLKLCIGKKAENV